MPSDRQVRLLSTNGTDESIAIILKDDNQGQDQDRDPTYYENHKPAMLEHSHNYYARNRETILFKKKLDNAKKETKDRRREYMKNYYQTNKEQLRRQRREYRSKKKMGC